MGYELYGSCALNLAMSIKAYDQTARILLVHDDVAIAHLSPEELKLFDFIKKADLDDYLIRGVKQYQRLKICVDKYTEFENTLYIDVDSIWFPEKKVSALMAALSDKDFWIGKNGFYNPLNRQKTGRTYTFWDEPIRIARYFGLRNPLPQTISGVFYFKKTEFTNKVFNRAREVYNDPKAPCAKWANGKPDEYCFNVALSELNYQQGDSHLVYFDKINGNLSNRQIYDNFWGLAIGGNRVPERVSTLYNDLVKMFSEAFGFPARLQVDKATLISERTRF